MTEGETPAAGWYADPDDETGTQLRWWDGHQWTERVGRRQEQEEVETGEAGRASPTREAEASTSPARGAREQDATPSSTRVLPPATRIVLPVGFWVIAIIALLLLLWTGAEMHDQGCYTKTAAQVASGNTSKSHCLLLPWNDPVTKQEKRSPFGY